MRINHKLKFDNASLGKDSYTPTEINCKDFREKFEATFIDFISLMFTRTGTQVCGKYTILLYTHVILQLWSAI